MSMTQDPPFKRVSLDGRKALTALMIIIGVAVGVSLAVLSIPEWIVPVGVVLVVVVVATIAIRRTRRSDTA